MKKHSNSYFHNFYLTISNYKNIKRLDYINILTFLFIYFNHILTTLFFTHYSKIS